MKKLICLALLLAMLVVALASCGGGKSDATEPEATKAATTVADPAQSQATSATKEATTLPPTTPDPWETYCEEVLALAEADRKLRIEFSEYYNAEKTSKNKDYVVGPDAVTESTPQIQQLVYNRNKEAVEKLGLDIEYVYYDYGWGQQSTQIKSVVQGQAEDAPDMFVNMIYDLNNALLFSSFQDTWSIPGSYFNFSSTGWYKDWMESMSLTGDRSYILAGDYFLDVLRAMTVLPFNLDMMDANAEKLKAFVGAADMTAGENVSDYFFDFVEEGNWTWEVLGQLCAAIWTDNNSDNADDIGDVLGIVGDYSSKLASAMYLYSAGVDGIFEEYVIEDDADPNNGKKWIRFPETSEALASIFDAVSSVYKGAGSLATGGGYAGATPETPGIAYHRIKFAEGTMLTAGASVLGALEDDAFQSMAQVYSVVPLPKLTVEAEYNTFIHNIGDAGAINVNSTKGKALSAFVQYCTENSAEIREEFLQVVTKYKTTRYNQGTDRMLDIIYGHMINGRDKMIEDAVSSSGGPGAQRWHAILDSGKYTTDASGLADVYQAAVDAKQAKLDEVIGKWYNLPKVEAAAE